MPLPDSFPYQMWKALRYPAEEEAGRLDVGHRKLLQRPHKIRFQQRVESVPGGELWRVGHQNMEPVLDVHRQNTLVGKLPGRQYRVGDASAASVCPLQTR